MSKRSMALKAQQEHYHRLGSLYRMIGLINWHLHHNTNIPPGVRQAIAVARTELGMAVRLETRNNSFINHSSTPYMQRGRK